MGMGMGTSARRCVGLRAVTVAASARRPVGLPYVAEKGAVLCHARIITRDATPRDVAFPPVRCIVAIDEDNLVTSRFVRDTCTSTTEPRIPLSCRRGPRREVNENAR